MPQDWKIQTFLDTYISHKRLTEKDFQLLERPITLEEALIVIKTLKNNKSPGKDGFTAELYKMYAQLLIVPLATTFNDILTFGCLPPSWNCATVVVIPEKIQGHIDPFHY